MKSILLGARTAIRRADPLPWPEYREWRAAEQKFFNAQRTLRLKNAGAVAREQTLLDPLTSIIGSNPLRRTLNPGPKKWECIDMEAMEKRSSKLAPHPAMSQQTPDRPPEEFGSSGLRVYRQPHQSAPHVSGVVLRQRVARGVLAVTDPDPEGTRKLPCSWYSPPWSEAILEVAEHFMYADLAPSHQPGAVHWLKLIYLFPSEFELVWDPREIHVSCRTCRAIRGAMRWGNVDHWTSTNHEYYVKHSDKVQRETACVLSGAHVRYGTNDASVEEVEKRIESYLNHVYRDEFGACLRYFGYDAGCRLLTVLENAHLFHPQPLGCGLDTSAAD